MMNERTALEQSKDFYIVEASALPEIILKVMEVKRLLESKNEKTIQNAVAQVGISRSAYYKYKDSVFPFYENSRGKTITFALNLDNTPGLLSEILNTVAGYEANVLTIHQTIPLNNIANVTLTIELSKTTCSDPSEMFANLQSIKGIQTFKILALE